MNYEEIGLVARAADALARLGCWGCPRTVAAALGVQQSAAATALNELNALGMAEHRTRRPGASEWRLAWTH